MNSEGGNHQKAGAVAFGWHNNAAPAQFTVGEIGFAPHWANAEDSMAASIIRLEQQNQELRAEVALLREQARVLQRERDEAREEAKRATYDAAQETIKVSTVKSHWIEACCERDDLQDQRDLSIRMAKERERERDEAREAFAVATSQAVEAREMLRRIMDWSPCLPEYEPDAQHLKWQADAFAARKFLEGTK